MSRRVVRGERAFADLAEITDYLAEGSPDAAARFVEEAERAFERLAAMPEIGAPYEPHDPAFAGIRVMTLGRFRNHIVFYRDEPPVVRILRVLRGSRDIHAVLLDELRPDGPDEADPSGD
jgi:plasmid stabilization system protein ParE